MGRKKHLVSMMCFLKIIFEVCSFSHLGMVYKVMASVIFTPESGGVWSPWFKAWSLWEALASCSMATNPGLTLHS